MGSSQVGSDDTGFGDVLRRLRRAAGLTQEELGERAGLSARGLSDVERGVIRYPRRDTVRALAEALALSPEDRATLERARRRPTAGTTPRMGQLADSAPASETQVPIHVFLIVDIRGYTTFTYAHGDEAGARLAMRFAQLVQEPIEARGGRIVELRGDEALCVFASARAALLAAVEVQARLATASQTDPTLPTPAGIGLDAGEAIAVEGGYRGLALNLAARLCAIAHPGEILLSETVLNLARKVDGLEYADRGRISFKGFADLVHVLQVLPTQALAPPAQPVGTTGDVSASIPTSPAAVQPTQPSLPVGGFLGAQPEHRLVAREDELARLLAALEAVQGGQGRVLVLVGEPGVGKTRLAQDVTLAARERGFLIATGRCYAPQESIAYFPFMEALGAAYDAAPAPVRALLPTRWSDVARLLPDPEVAVRAGLGQVVGGVEDQQRLFRQVTGFLEALAETQPLAVLLDDLHWADGASVSLLQHLARHTRAARLLLLGTYRDVEVPLSHPLGKAVRDLGREQLVERIDVRRLSPAGTAALVTSALGEGEVTAAITELVHAPTEGNPFFAHEVLRTLVERGDIYQVDGRWERREGSEVALPESVRGLIQDRVAHLSDATQETLSEASVLGQRFAFEDLLAMQAHVGAGDSSEAALESALEEAVFAGLVREAGRDDYAFSHALTQQALYAELHMRRKRRLHRAAALALEGLPVQQRERRAGELAYHFLEAGDGALALPYALMAGDRAKSVYANTEAERHYRTALALARAHDDRAHEAEALERLGDLFWSQGNYERVLETLPVVIESLRQVADREAIARPTAFVARAYGRLARVQEGLDYLMPFVEARSAAGIVLLERDPPGAQAAVYTALADLYYHGGHYRDQLGAAERAVQAARASSDREAVVKATHLLGIALTLLGRRDTALEALQEAISVAEVLGDWFVYHNGLRHLSDIYERDGDFRAAGAAVARSLKYGDHLGPTPAFTILLYRSGLHAFETGDWSTMRRSYERAAAIWEGLARHWTYAYAPFALGQLNLVTGHWPEGTRLLEEAVKHSTKGRNLHIQRKAQHELAEAELLMGRAQPAWLRLDPLVAVAGQEEEVDVIPLLPLIAWADLELEQSAPARALLEEAAERAHLQHHQLAMLDVLRVRAMLHLREEQWPAAEESLVQALASCRAMPYPYAEAKLLYCYGQMHAAKGEPERARERFEAALAICARLGEGLYRPHIEHALAAIEGR